MTISHNENITLWDHFLLPFTFWDDFGTFGNPREHWVQTKSIFTGPVTVNFMIFVRM